MTKADFRRQLRAQLDQLNFQDLIARSGDLSDRFHDWVQTFGQSAHSGNAILSYYPFGTEPQVQVEPSDPAEAAKIRYQVCYPRIEDWSTRMMQPRFARRDLPGQWEEFDLPGGNKIFQPLVTQPLCPPDQIAAILVPGLGFTQSGSRLGRGAGFYDRFLAQVPAALRIGIAFEMQLVANLPSDAHDLPVDIILTESRLIETKRYSQWKIHGRIERE